MISKFGDRLKFKFKFPQTKINLVIKQLALGIATIVLVVACNCQTELQNLAVVQTRSPTPADVLQIWWDKGYLTEEDEALKRIIRNWQKESHHQIQLSFYSNDELPERVQRAIQAGTFPDLVMCSSGEPELNPQLAWSGKLADVSEIIEPIKDSYDQSALKSVNYYNSVTQTRGYYGVPISQFTIHIFYWRDLLQQAGKTEADIPQDWNRFWQFWQQVQDSLATQSQQQIYGLGFSLAAGSADTYYLFEQILAANDVNIINTAGELIVDLPQVRQSIINCLAWYTDFYTEGHLPPDAVDWLNPDNNRNLLQRSMVMTPNMSLSIPAAVRKNDNLDIKQLGIIEFPNQPNNKPSAHLVSVNSVVLLKESQHQELAKDFLKYLVKPNTLSNYLRASGGRYLPVTKPVWQTLAWENSSDEHFAIPAKTILEGKTHLFKITNNPAYSSILQQKVWGQALNRIAVHKIPVEQAADEAIAQIQDIFANWGNSAAGLEVGAVPEPPLQGVGSKR